MPFVTRPLGTQRQQQQLTMSTGSRNDSNGDDGKQQFPRKRRVRKDSIPKEKESMPQQQPESQRQTNPSSVQETIELKPREDAMIQFKIQDIREVMSGEISADSDDSTNEEEEEDDDDDSDDENDDDDEWEYVDINEEEDNDEYEYMVVDSTGKELNSLERLLADAKSFRIAEDEQEKQDKETMGEETGFKMPTSVLGVISTIVTIDFFVVIALLLWFLAGIFGQYVLKDETVQIAFNNIFQPVVQPALGILMIGSAAGAMFKEEDKEM